MSESGNGPAAIRAAGTVAWYWLVTVATIGICAWVPFLHAAGRLHRPALRRRAALYGALGAAIVLLLAITPSHRDSATAHAIPIIGFAVLLSTVLSALPQQWTLSWAVPAGSLDAALPSAGPGHLPPVDAAGADPAVSAVLVARQRRQQSRQLAAADPLMARDLHIGRPDLARSYDDGGLVDLNSAPAAVIAEVCGVDGAVAQAIVTARARNPFFVVDDVLTAVDVPVGSWDAVRDRAIVLPR